MADSWTTALVTGASGGIGEAIARRLAAEGVPSVLVARRADRLDALAAELRNLHGVACEVLPADLADATAVGRVAERLADLDRPVDLLVNNAGQGRAGEFADGDPAASRLMVDLNVGAVVALCHAAVPAMLHRGRGWVMNVSSMGGHTPGPRFAVYAATKAFVTSFSEALHEELRDSGVRVTAVCPGATRTDFGATSGSAGDHLPRVLWQTADEVAREALAATAAGRAVRVTGLVNRVSAAASTAMPRAVNRRVAAMVTDRL